MVILPRRSLILLACSLVLVCVLIGLQVPAPVRAGGAPPTLPVGNSIKPGEETPIQMSAEVVTMNIRPATEADNALVKLNPKSYGPFSPIWFPAIAEVEADFTMKNPTSEAVSLTAWFPLASTLENVEWKLNRTQDVPYIMSFQVSVDGDPVDYAVSELPNPKGADRPLLPWASFPVTFPGGVETVIHVSYKLPPQPSGNAMILYYIFQTGAGWAGPIGRAELILNLPYPASAETLAGMPSGSLRLPTSYLPTERADLPSSAVLEGNQARWTWKDFEPDPGDDYAVWLLRPDQWQELEIARAAVQSNPQDGQAWLDLAYTYYSLSETQFLLNSPLSIFSPSYNPQGIAAYQKAADLLPEHPAPHAGLGMLILAPYFKDKNAPPEVIQYVQDEYQIAKELDAKNPSLLKEAGVSGKVLVWLESALNSYFSNAPTAMAQVYATKTAEAALYNDATATAFEISWACWAAAKVGCDDATATAFAATRAVTAENKVTQTSSLAATLTPNPTPTRTPIPSARPQPPPTTPSTTAETTGNGQSMVIIVAAIVIVLVVVGYLILKRSRKRA